MIAEGGLYWQADLRNCLQCLTFVCQRGGRRSLGFQLPRCMRTFGGELTVTRGSPTKRVDSYQSEGKRLRVSGTVLLTVEVTSSGEVTKLWVSRPFGLGLDKETVKTVKA